jgi:hypothetical protein
MLEMLAIYAIGAGTVLLVQGGRGRAKNAVGWMARQAGFLSSRVRADLAAVRQITRDEFIRARAANAGPTAAPTIDRHERASEHH